MPRKSILILTLILIIYVLLSVYRPGGLMAYVLPTVCWLSFTITILQFCGVEKIRAWFSKPLTFIAWLVAMLQIIILTFIALFTGFGKSPYAFTPTAIMINIAYFISPLIAFEFSRAYLIKSSPRNRVLDNLVLLSLFYTIMSLPLSRFLALREPIEIMKFVGSEILPTLAQNLFATYLALFGGPIASIAYLGTLESFEWLCPILPNPPWSIRSLITAIIPLIGFYIATQSVDPFTLMRYGIIGREEAFIEKRLTKGGDSLGVSWIIIAVMALILLWGSTGLLGFQPSIIASGSMRPAMDVGDIAITIQTTTNKIKVGDIIQYWRSGETAPTIHRVIEIGRSGETIIMVTKGDANDAPDKPITLTTTQSIGKVILVIPKIGWVSIYMKNAMTVTVRFLMENQLATYITVTALIAASAIRACKSVSRLKTRIRR